VEEKVNKAILLIVLLVLLLTGSISQGLVASTETNVLELSLEAAVKTALVQNPQVELSRLGIKKARLKLDEANHRADQLEEKMDLVGATFDMLRGRYVAPRAAKMELNLAMRNEVFQANLLKFNVESHYYGLSRAKAASELAQTALLRAREQLRLAEVGYKAGTLAKGEILGAQVLVAATETEALSAKNNYQVAMMRLNKTLGLPLDQKLALTDKLQYRELHVELTGVLARAREFDPQLLLVSEAVKVQEENFKQAQLIFAPNVFAYRQAEYDLAEARVNLARQEQELELAVRQSLLNLETAAGAHQVLEQNLTVAQEHLRVANLRFAAGAGTRIEAMRAAEELQRVENNALEALANYNLAVMSVTHLIFMPGGGSR